jgi:hypothetical protein
VVFLSKQGVFIISNTPVAEALEITT